MKEYLKALKYCYENGEDVNSRAGNVRKAFGYQMRFDLNIGFPAVELGSPSSFVLCADLSVCIT